MATELVYEDFITVYGFDYKNLDQHGAPLVCEMQVNKRHISAILSTGGVIGESGTNEIVVNGLVLLKRANLFAEKVVLVEKPVEVLMGRPSAYGSV